MRACARPRMSPEREQPRMQTYISCESAQAKRMSRFHKSHFIEKFTGKMLRPKTAPQTLCEPAQSKRMSRFHCDPKQHSYRVDGIGNRRREEVERRETLCASLRASQNEPRTQTAQNADIHVVRACPVETHVKISQEPLDTEIYRKNAAPQIEPGTQTHILCEPAQSKCMSTCHKKHQKSHFIRKFTGKMPRPRLGPEGRHTFCASLRSRNACQDFTRAT